MGALQWTAFTHRGERRAVQPDRHHVWRGRADDFRRAGFAWPNPDPPFDNASDWRNCRYGRGDPHTGPDWTYASAARVERGCVAARRSVRKLARPHHYSGLRSGAARWRRAANE